MWLIFNIFKYMNSSYAEKKKKKTQNIETVNAQNAQSKWVLYIHQVFWLLRHDLSQWQDNYCQMKNSPWKELWEKWKLRK